MTYSQPLTLLFLLTSLVALYRLRRHHDCKEKTWGLLTLGLLGLFLLTWPPVDWVVSRPLEVWYPRQAFPTGEAEAIVVLSAGVKPAIPERPYPLLDEATFERCEHASWLYKNWRQLPVLACGGVGETGSEAFSLTMRRVLQGEGVPPSMVWTEQRSRSTYENALFGAEILRKNSITRVALVVDASDMPRAERCFRKQGFVVLPAPCGFRRFEWSAAEFVPGWRAIYHNERILHETVGLIWYRIRGWV